MASILKNKRVLALPWGQNMGHIVRCMVLAQALVALGARVTVVIERGREHEDLVKRGGCEPIFYPEDIVLDNPWSHWSEPSFVQASIDADVGMMTDSGADLVIHDGRFSSPVAAEIMGLPSFAIVQSAHLAGQTYAGKPGPAPVWVAPAKAFNDYFRSRGLPEIAEDARELYLKGELLLASIPEIEPVPADLAMEHIHYIGPLTPLSGSAPRSVGTSSAEVKRREGIFFYRTVDDETEIEDFLAAFGDLGHRVTVATGDELLTRNLTAAFDGSDICVHTLADMSEIAIVASIAIHKGGHGICMTVLQAGLVSLILADTNPERYANAQALERLGVATVIASGETGDSPGFLKPGAESRRLEWASVRQLVDAIRADSSMAAAAAKWSDRLSEYGLDRATEVISHSLTSLHRQTAPRDPR